MMGEGNKLQDDSRDGGYFYMTPHIVHNLCRNTFDLALWSTIKMVAGEDGECYLTTQELADFAMMSAGQVHNSRQYLLSVGLLKGGIWKDPGPYNAVWHLSIPDLWEKNIKWRQANEKLLGRIELKRAQRKAIKAQRKAERAKRADSQGESDSPCEKPPTPSEKPPTPGETKKNHQGKPERTTPHAQREKQKSDAAVGDAAVGGGGSSLSDEEQELIDLLKSIGIGKPAEVIKQYCTSENELKRVARCALYARSEKRHDRCDNAAGLAMHYIKDGSEPPKPDYGRVVMSIGGRTDYRLIRCDDRPQRYSNEWYEQQMANDPQLAFARQVKAMETGARE